MAIAGSKGWFASSHLCGTSQQRNRYLSQHGLRNLIMQACQSDSKLKHSR